MNIFVRAIPLLLMVIIAVYLIVAKKRKIKGNSVILALFLVIESIAISKIDFPSILYDEVKVSISQDKNYLDKQIVINGLVYHDSNQIFVHRLQMPFPEIIDGRWEWQDYRYKWMYEEGMLVASTDSITLKVPVYSNRFLLFETGPNDGKVSVEINGEIQEYNLYAKTDGELSVKITDPPEDRLFYNLGALLLIFGVISAILLVVIAFFCNVMYERVCRFVKRKPYELTFFSFSLIQIMMQGRFPYYYEYTSSFYALNYELGVVKRGLWGTVFTSVFPYMTESQLRIFKLVFAIALYVFLSCLIGSLVRKIQDRGMRWFFVLLFCSLPNTYLYVANDVLPTDILSLVLFIVSVMLITKNKGVWIVPLLTVLMLLIMETTIVYYVPVICLMMIFCYILEHDKSYIAYLLLTVVLDIPLALYFLTSESPLNKKTINTVLHHISYHAGYKYSESAFVAETFELKNHIASVSQYLMAHRMESIIIFVFLIPLFSLLFRILSVVYRKGLKESVIMERLVFFVLVISCFFSTICMLIAWDFPRYTSIILVTLLATIFFVMEKKRVSIAYTDISNPRFGVRINENTSVDFIPILICLFYVVCGTFNNTFIDTEYVSKFVNFMLNII